MQVIIEQGSFLPEKLSGMKKLLALVGEQVVDVVFIENPDRLVSFGFSSFELAFTWKGFGSKCLINHRSVNAHHSFYREWHW